VEQEVERALEDREREVEGLLLARLAVLARLTPGRLALGRGGARSGAGRLLVLGRLGRERRPPRLLLARHAGARTYVAAGTAAGTSAKGRPRAEARARASSARAAKLFGVSDCAPSDSAWSGEGCTSIISPSAPTAIAPIDIGCTRYHFPVPWEGSA